MTPGRFIAVVGPSGVGKDSLMAGIAAACPAIRRVRRTITRAPDLGGEDYDAVSPEQFVKAVAAGAFCLHWSAHGLSYGIPRSALDDTARGIDCLANLSRAALTKAAGVFPRLLVLNVTATPETLARRLKGRAREGDAEIARRLARAQTPLPAGLDILTLPNDGALGDTVSRAVALLRPSRV